MSTKEKRKHPRIEVNAPVSYTGKNSLGCVLEAGMGIVRDVSKSGIRVNLFQIIESQFIWLTFVNVEKNLISIRGEVIYCKKGESGGYIAGIRFHGEEEQKTKFATELIRFYYGHKTKTPTPPTNTQKCSVAI